MAAKGSKARVDHVMVEQGLAPTLAKATALVMAGDVLLGDQRVDKPGMMVPTTAPLRLRSEIHDFVSRGALKLVRALDEFAVDVTGVVALDVGASTGGFTDVLLRRGAAKVYAIDVGYGQLAWSLRQDARVVVMDRQNVRALAKAQVPGAHAAVIDTSFISLVTVLPVVAELIGGGAGGRGSDSDGRARAPRWIIALIKPQFEVGREALDGGVVRSQEDRDRAIANILALCQANGWRTSDVVPSPITGPAGNIEYLVHISI